MHFLFAAIFAWILRGNIMAALLATFFGNPLTFPLIGSVSMELGSYLLQQPNIPLPQVLAAFSNAALELWRNSIALFTEAQAEWGRLEQFWQYVFMGT